MAIVSQNAILNQYVPVFNIKNIIDGQILVYDAVTKGFVNKPASSELPGTVKAFSTVVPLNANGTVLIGTPIPTGYTILSVKVKVTVPDTTATLSVGTVYDGIAAFMPTADNDPQLVGLYVTELLYTMSSTQQVIATVAGSSGIGSGSCTVLFTYQIPQ